MLNSRNKVYGRELRAGSVASAANIVHAVGSQKILPRDVRTVSSPKQAHCSGDANLDPLVNKQRTLSLAPQVEQNNAELRAAIAALSSVFDNSGDVQKMAT